MYMYMKMNEYMTIVVVGVVVRRPFTEGTIFKAHRLRIQSCLFLAALLGLKPLSNDSFWSVDMAIW